MTDPPDPLGEEAEADRQIREIAARLGEMQEALGPGYWDNAEVRELQEALRSRIGGYGSWGPDKPPMHTRSRRAAAYEREFARLLWPW